MRRVSLFFISSFVVLSLLGCQYDDLVDGNKVSDDINAGEIVAGVHDQVDQTKVIVDETIEVFKGDPVKTYDVIYTLNEVLSLTFDRILSKEDLLPLLDQLDYYGIKGTFFSSFEQITMYPEAVNEIIERGHSIESNALYKTNLKSLKYDDIYQLMLVNSREIEEMTGSSPTYVRLHSSKKYSDVNKVASQLGMSGVVHYSYQLRGLKTDDEDKLMRYMNRAVARGGILSMDPEDAHAIPYLMEAVESVNFNVIPLTELIALDQGRKSFKEIEGAS